MPFIDELRTVLQDTTRLWHLASRKDYIRRFELLSDKDQGDVREALDRGRQAFKDIHQVFQKVP